MLLVFFAVYLALGLLFASLCWMALVVAKKHDEEKGYLQINEPVYSGD
jgi:hypothetical protein